MVVSSMPWRHFLQDLLFLPGTLVAICVVRGTKSRIKERCAHENGSIWRRTRCSHSVPLRENKYLFVAVSAWIHCCLILFGFMQSILKKLPDLTVLEPSHICRVSFFSLLNPSSSWYFWSCFRLGTYMQLLPSQVCCNSTFPLPWSKFSGVAYLRLFRFDAVSLLLPLPYSTCSFRVASASCCSRFLATEPVRLQMMLVRVKTTTGLLRMGWDMLRQTSYDILRQIGNNAASLVLLIAQVVHFFTVVKIFHILPCIRCKIFNLRWKDK